MIAAILLSNFGDNKFYAEMYNDQIMMLYILICIYLSASNRPILASLFFTLALSIKAGAALLLPAFAG